MLLAAALAILLVVERKSLVGAAGRIRAGWRSPGLWLSAFAAYTVAQLFFPHAAVLRMALVMVAVAATYGAFRVGLTVSGRGLQPLFRLAAALALASTVLLLLQVHVSVDAFDPIPLLDEWGIVDDTLRDRTGYASTVAHRGRGFALTVGEYSTHNFLPLAFLGLMVLRARAPEVWTSAGALGLLAAGIVTSDSQGYFVAAGAALGAYAATRWASHRGGLGGILGAIRRHPLAVAVAGTAAILALAATVAVAASRIDWSHGDSVTQRLYYWDVAFHMFLTQPVFGTGLGAYPYLFAQYRPVIGEFSFVPDPSEPHSLVLQLLAGSGLVGFALYGGFVVATFAAVGRLASRPMVADEDRILFFTWWALVVHSLFGNHLVLLDLYLVSALVVYRESSLSSREDPSPGRSSGAATSIAPMQHESALIPASIPVAARAAPAGGGARERRGGDDP